MPTVLLPPPPPRAPTAVDPGRQPPRREEPPPNYTAAWTLVAALLAFKVGTITFILIVAKGFTGDVLLMLLAMNWLWVIPLVLLISAIPFAFWFRLLRARTKRRRLLRAEWALE